MTTVEGGPSSDDRIRDDRARGRPPEPREPVIAQHLKVVHLLAGSMMAGVVIFGAVALVLLQSPDFAPRPGALPDFLAPGLALTAIVMLLSGPIIMRKLAARPAPDAAAALQRHRTKVVVGHALWEGAGALGILLALLAGHVTWGYGLAAAALVMMGIAWPKREDIELPD